MKVGVFGQCAKKFVHLKKGLNPETFLVTCILKKKNNNKSFNIFERLPGNLLK